MDSTTKLRSTALKEATTELFTKERSSSRLSRSVKGGFELIPYRALRFVICLLENEIDIIFSSAVECSRSVIRMHPLSRVSA